MSLIELFKLQFSIHVQILQKLWLVYLIIIFLAIVVIVLTNTKKRKNYE